jgi:hypothetical protein
MEPSQVQLILNVIGITAVTSLTTMGILHRRENCLNVQRHKQDESQTSPQSASGATRHTPAQEQDVRKLAEAKRGEWVQALSSAISFTEAIQQDR